MQQVTDLRVLEVLSKCTPATFTVRLLRSSSWPSLSHISLEYEHISTPLVHAIGELPRLQRLDVSDDNDSMDSLNASHTSETDATTVATAPSTYFRSLQTLNIESWRLSNVEAFLMFIPRNNSIERVKSTCWNKSDPADVQDAINCIAQHCNPNKLRHVELHDTEDDIRLLLREESSLEEVDGREEDLDISPMYAFRALQTLTVACAGSPRLLPQAVTTICRSWPEIQHLDLCPSWACPGRIPAINHVHVLEIAKGCPSLRYLGLRFNATQITRASEDRDFDTPSISQAFQLSTLRVGESPIYSPSGVVAFLKSRFPSLDKLDAFYHHLTVDNVGVAPLLDRRWAVVVGSLQ